MFKSKFEKNYRKELRREIKIQNIMAKHNFNRVQAVHQFDYEEEINRQFIWSK